MMSYDTLLSMVSLNKWSTARTLMESHLSTEGYPPTLFMWISIHLWTTNVMSFWMFTGCLPPLMRIADGGVQLGKTWKGYESYGMSRNMTSQIDDRQ